MKPHLRTLAIALAGLALAAPAEAQFIPGTSPMDMSVQSRALTSSIINRNALRASARPSARSRVTPTPPRAHRGSSDVPSDGRFPFQASPALREQVLSDFVRRTSRSSPEAAKAVAAEFRRPDFQQWFASAVQPFGFSPNDAADVMAVYLVSGWEIVHGTDANPTALRAVRRQVAGQMAGNAALRDPTTRARLAEELKIITTLFASSVENAKREGNAAQFAAGVAAHYRQTTSYDLRTIQLTSQGFSDG
jgi:hypothetical protein